MYNYELPDKPACLSLSTTNALQNRAMAIFGAGTVIPEAAIKMLGILIDARK